MRKYGGVYVMCIVEGGSKQIAGRLYNIGSERLAPLCFRMLYYDLRGYHTATVRFGDISLTVSRIANKLSVQ